MTNSPRIIASLELIDGRVIKGINFTNMVDAADPVESASIYQREGADEIVFQDSSERGSDRDRGLDFLRATSELLTIPITFSGGINSVKDVDRALHAGANKVSIESAELVDPSLIAEIVDRFGSQVLVLALDARRARSESGFEVKIHAGQGRAEIDLFTWIEKVSELGIGEILLNSIDVSGTRAGFDLGMIKAVRDMTRLPLIADGGAGAQEDFAAALEAGADALLASSSFSFGIHRIPNIKKYLAAHGYSLRDIDLT